MSQHDLEILTADANTGAAMRSAINSALQACGSNQSGAVAPGTTYPCQFWADTGSSSLKMRNSTNSDWVVVGPLDVPYMGMVMVGTPSTITAQHNFSVGSTAPFTLSTATQGYKVTGLHADQLDGAHASTAAAANTIPISSTSGKIGAAWLNLEMIAAKAQDFLAYNSSSVPQSVFVWASYLTLQDSSGDVIRVSSTTAAAGAADITVAGAGGLDAGSPASGLYYVWAIAKADGSKDLLLSTSASSPTMPAGYTYKLLLTSGYYSTGSTSFRAFTHSGHEYNFNTPVQVATTAVCTTSYSTVSVSPYIPPGRESHVPWGYSAVLPSMVRGYVNTLSSAAATRQLYIAGYDGAAGVAEIFVTRSQYIGAANYDGEGMFQVPLIDSDIAFKSNGANMSVNIWITGYTL